MSAEGPATPAPTGPWQLPNFRWLWLGMCVSTLGSHTAGIVYPLLVLAITSSPAIVGWVTALRLAPFVLLCLPVGAMVDRWDRRRVMLRCDIGRFVVVGSLPLAMFWSEPSLVHIMVVAVLEGTLMVFYNLAEVAALPRVVPRPLLPRASALNQAGYATAGIAGPALGTTLYQLSRALPFAVDALTYAISAFTLWRMKGDFAPLPVGEPRHIGAEIMTGLRWLWNEKIVRQMSLLTGAMNFIEAAMPLLLIVMAQRMKASPAEIGLIFSLAGVGGVLGALVGGQIQRYVSFGRVLIGTTLLRAALFPLLAFAPGALWLGVVYGVTHFLGLVYNVVQFSHRIALIPPGMEGRVNASFRFIAHLPAPLGALLCGALLERADADAGLAVFAALFALLAIVAATSRTIRYTQSLQQT